MNPQLQALPPAAQRRERGPRSMRLWLPLTPLLWLLAPFALVLAPLLLLVRSLRRTNPYAAAFALGRVLLALGGTEIDIDAPQTRLRLKIL